MNAATSLLARVGAVEAERAKAERLMAARFAPRFNPVALLMPGETRLSEVFRWLLDEDETHGQGTLYRDRFLRDLLCEQPEQWERARVRCEVATADGLGRIDLLMESEDSKRCLVIENKPWAGWQADQISRYLADQSIKRGTVRVHALIGSADAEAALSQHWLQYSREPLPPAITASGFDAVAVWLDECARMTRPDSVRNFLYDMADYCRRFIMSEVGVTEIGETAALIVAGGEEALRAARAIAAAVPLAMSMNVAARVNGTTETVGINTSIRISVDGVPVDFVLFGTPSPWAGVTDDAAVDLLQGAMSWAAPERRWPRWIYLRKAGGEGGALVDAVSSQDIGTIADLLPLVALAMIGNDAAT